MTELKRYEDADGIRFYDTPIGKLPSATSVLRVLNKPAILGWAVKQAAEYMRGVLADLSEKGVCKGALTDKVIDAWVKEAKAAHRKTSTEAMDIGSAVHAWIEGYFSRRLEMGARVLVPVNGEELVQPITAFLQWDEENNVKPICVEERIWSKERFAGTLDLYAEVGGQLTLLDFKSSTGHWPENVMQLGAYDLAFRERTGNKVDRYMVVRLDKLTGVPDPKEYSREEVELGAKRFLAILNYWWLSNGNQAQD